MGILFAVIFIAVLIVVAFIALSHQTESSAQDSEQQTQEHPQRGWQYMYLIKEVKRQAEERGDTETVQQCLDMTYDSQMPVCRPDNTFTSIYNPVWKINIAGINFCKGVSKYVGPFFGYLEPEPENQYDKNAIAIHHSDGKRLGYIPADETDDIRDQGIAFPATVFGRIDDDYNEEEHRKFYRGHIFLEIPDPNRTHPVEKSDIW